MAHINVRIIDDREDDTQYQSIGAYLELLNKEFLLDDVLLGTENYEEDLDLIEGFCGGFEMMAEESGMEIVFDPKIQELIKDLEFDYAQEQEQKGIEEDKL
ncbi:MAG: hypothetical protein WCT77_01960 [Bacteroidota bacterium]|jgi:hypothetical protein